MRPRLDIQFPFRMQRSFLRGNPYLPEKNEFLLNHARSGILLALQALKLTPGSRVGVLAYNCHTVFNAVSQAGCVAVFLDVTERMTIDMADFQKKAEDLSALVVTHLFGIQNDVAFIQDRFPHLPIIEDCAHAYGISEIRGDFAVFSIGQGKLPSLGDGGILRVRNGDYLEETKRLYDLLPGYGASESAKLFCSMWLKAFLHRPFVYSLITAPLKRFRGIPDGREWITPKRMCQGVQAMYREECSFVKKEIEDQIDVAREQQSFLSSLSGVRSVFYGLNAFMLLALCEDVEPIQSCFRKKGVETATHFSNCLDWASQFGYVRGMCPNTERLVKNLLMIPTYWKR